MQALRIKVLPTNPEWLFSRVSDFPTGRSDHARMIDLQGRERGQAHFYGAAYAVDALRLSTLLAHYYGAAYAVDALRLSTLLTHFYGAACAVDALRLSTLLAHYYGAAYAVDALRLSTLLTGPFRIVPAWRSNP